MKTNHLRWFARIIALAWSGFWIWFGLASGIGEGGNLFEILRHTFMPGLILLSSVVVAWRWEKIGIWIFIGLGIIITILYPIVMNHMTLSTKIFVWLTMGLPPLLAGGALLIAGSQSKFTSKLLHDR